MLSHNINRRSGRPEASLVWHSVRFFSLAFLFFAAALLITSAYLALSSNNGALQLAVGAMMFAIPALGAEVFIRRKQRAFREAEAAYEASLANAASRHGL